MYKVYGGKKNRSFRVLWALEELELPYELITASPRSDEIVAMNPSGKVPCFKDGEDVLTDSVAIIQYLADKHGALTFPAGTIKRGQQDGLMQFANDEMDANVWVAARHGFILPEDKRVPAIKPVLRWEFSRSMKILAERLGDNQFLMGDTFTVADIIAAHTGTWARLAKFETGQPVVEDYIDRCIARPAYKRATEA